MAFTALLYHWASPVLSLVLSFLFCTIELAWMVPLAMTFYDPMDKSACVSFQIPSEE